MQLEKRNDPPCPKCGCRDCPEIAAGPGARWGKQYKQGVALDEDDERVELATLRRCQHCRATFRAADPAARADGEVLHVRLRCPHCNSDRHKVTRTIAGDETVRYHKCECGLTFKSRSI